MIAVNKQNQSYFKVTDQRGKPLFTEWQDNDCHLVAIIGTDRSGGVSWLEEEWRERSDTKWITEAKLDCSCSTLGQEMHLKMVWFGILGRNLRLQIRAGPCEVGHSPVVGHRAVGASGSVISSYILASAAVAVFVLGALQTHQKCLVKYLI